MTRIILYLKGQPFQEIEIDPLPDERLYGITKEKMWKYNFEARENQLNANIRGLRSIYWKQIQKVGFDSFVVVVFQSKINEQIIAE